MDYHLARLSLAIEDVTEGYIMLSWDDDQSIYNFQGAYLTNFIDFQSSYFKKDLTEIILSQNYRSTKNITKISEQLLESEPNRKRKNLFTDNEDGEKVTVAKCSNDIAEVEFVVQKIRELLNKEIRDGTEAYLSYKDFVILSRRKIEGQKFFRAFRTYGIPSVENAHFGIFVTTKI